MLQRQSCSRRNNVKSSLEYSSHTSRQTLVGSPWLQYGFRLLGEENREGAGWEVLNGTTYKVLHAGSEPKVQRNDVTQTGKVRCFQLEETPELLLDQWKKKTVFSRGWRTCRGRIQGPSWGEPATMTTAWAGSESCVKNLGLIMSVMGKVFKHWGDLRCLCLRKHETGRQPRLPSGDSWLYQRKPK